MMKKRFSWLAVGWRVMVVGGLINVFLSLATPYMMLFVDPRATYGSQDVLYVGKTYEQVVAFSPQLAWWIVLMMISMCGMMMGFGILITAVAATAYRRGERWSWWALTVANILVFIYNGTLTILYLSKGLYGFSSGVSVGLAAFIVWILLLVFGLILPAPQILSRRRE